MEERAEKILGKGSILFHSRFKFENGELGEKLIIILNDPDPSKEPFLTCRVTSKEKNKPREFGCHAERSLFFLPARRDFFEKDTWIQLFKIFPFEASSLLKDHFNGALEVIGELQRSTLQQLMSCIRSIQDIEKRYKEMILH